MFDRKTLDELYDYTDFAWAMLAKTCSSLPDGTLAKPAPGAGWPALSNAFYHLLESYDGWLHGTLDLGAVVGPTVESFAEWRNIQACRDAVRATFRKTLDTTPDDELFKLFTRTYDEDGPETMSLGDILANLLLHERGHHGDFNTLFWQLGIEQPFMDYRMYVYLKRNPDSHYRPPGW